MLDLSVIIVSWNAREHLLNCLRSLGRGISEYSLEVIVVDNASSDGSAEAVQNEFSAVRLIRNETNLGFARANNIGIRQSSGRYICLMNSDIIVLPHCLDRLIAFLDQNPRVGLAGPRILNLDHTIQITTWRFPTLWNSLCEAFALDRIFPKMRFFSGSTMSYWSHNSIRRVDGLSGCFWVIRREASDRIGLLDENFFMYSEDIDWCRRCNKMDWHVVYYPIAEAIHIRARSSTNDPVRFYLELQKANLLYWKKHHGVFGKAFRMLIIFLHEAVRVVLHLAFYAFSPSRRAERAPKIKRGFACIRWGLRF